MRYRNIIWDYNGTIINDAQLAVDAENLVLQSYGKPTITLEYYLKESEMPLINFYKKIFDLDNYDYAEIAQKFINYYDELFETADIFPEVREMILYLSDKGCNQGVISGFETSRLTNSLKKFELDKYFQFMSGSDGVDGGDKSDRAVKVIKKYGFAPEETLFIGDMYHDCETAQKVGADCVLIAKGHQGAEVLRSYGVNVLDSAEELKTILL